MIDFVKLVLQEQTNESLLEFCKTHRLGLADTDDQSSLSAADFKFHVTVMYSKVTNPAFREGECDFVHHVLQPEAFDMFGPNHDILALGLHADGVLTGLFDFYGEAYGHVSDFMPYRPHITIRGGNADMRSRIGSIPLPDFELRTHRIVHKVKKD
jgi:hypothetical protein